MILLDGVDDVLPSVSQESKQQILQPLSVLRPKFRVSQLEWFLLVLG